MLQDYFEDIDWQMFFNCCNDTDELTETITEYMKFCEANVTTKKTIRAYPNNYIRGFYRNATVY